MKFITNRTTCRMSIISSIMIRAFMISISSSQIRLLFRTLAATIPTADRTGLLSAEKCRRHLSAGTDSGRAEAFYHIATFCSSPADESLLSRCCVSKRLQKPTCHGIGRSPKTEACLPVAASCLGGASAETEGREPGDGKLWLSILAALSATRSLRSGF